MLHVAQADHIGSMADANSPMGVQPYCFLADIANAVKRTVSIPVSIAGRVTDPDMAEGMLQADRADIIELGRPLLADPDWTNKAAANKVRDIRRCISCNEGCVDNILNRSFIACVLNTENGFEESRAMTPAVTKRKVVVIVGGPAGLEAARVATRKGHSVTLFERETQSGGQLIIAEMPPRKEERRRTEQDLVHAVRTEGVAPRLGDMATARSLLALASDAVIVAVAQRASGCPFRAWMARMCVVRGRCLWASEKWMVQWLLSVAASLVVRRLNISPNEAARCRWWKVMTRSPTT